MCVQGKNVLFHCIDNDTEQSVIDYVLHKGSAYLVTQRIEVGGCGCLRAFEFSRHRVRVE